MAIPNILSLFTSNQSESTSLCRSNRIRFCASVTSNHILISWSNRIRCFMAQFSAGEALRQQMVALQTNDHPYPDHGVEVMYRVGPNCLLPFFQKIHKRIIHVFIHIHIYIHTYICICICIYIYIYVNIYTIDI